MQITLDFVGFARTRGTAGTRPHCYLRNFLSKVRSLLGKEVDVGTEKGILVPCCTFHMRFRVVK